MTRTWPAPAGVLSPASGSTRYREAAALVARAVAAAGVLLSADVHLDLWATGFRDIPTIGTLFLLNAVGGFVIGPAVLAWRHWLTLVAAAGFGAATLVAFYISATRGLYGVHETLGGVQQVTAQVAQFVAVGGAVIAWALERLGHARD